MAVVGLFEVLVGVALIMGCAIPAALMFWLVMNVALQRRPAAGDDVTPIGHNRTRPQSEVQDTGHEAAEDRAEGDGEL